MYGDYAGSASRWSPGDSGNVSQSHSVCSSVSAGLPTEEEDDAGKHGAPPALPDHLLPAAASSFSGYMLQGYHQAESETLEKCLEDLLIRDDEFVGMLEMIRNDTSQVINDRVPQIRAKASEMRKLYQKIDKLIMGDVAPKHLEGQGCTVLYCLLHTVHHWTITVFLLMTQRFATGLTFLEGSAK
uniref:Uncharacterized protein n=1 Tax=Leptobrachium leishanense TaxID=445787 RepID=A0A8C5LYY8_9ANUR